MIDVPHIEGPVYPLLPAFDQHENFDVAATGTYVDYLCSEGARTLMITAGTSRLNLLSNEELLSFNRIAAEVAAGRATVIGATPIVGGTQALVQFGRECRRVGVDALLALYPERYYGDEAVVAFFAALDAGCGLPLMLHAMPMRSGTRGMLEVDNFSTTLLERLADIPTFFGLKEEHGDAVYRRELLGALGERLTFVAAGGGMGTFLQCRSEGAQAYLTSAGSFKPAIEVGFFDALKKEDTKFAERVVQDVEPPLFEVAVPLGWHRAMKGLLAVLGLLPAYERGPLAALDGAEQELLIKLVERLKW